MKRKLSYLLILVLLLCATVAQGQDAGGAKPKKPRTLDDYELRTLREIAAKKVLDDDSRGNKQETTVVHADIIPSRVRVTYAGSARPMPQLKKEALRQWARLYAGFPEGYTEPYETEMLFTENGREYWLAVRKKAAPSFEKEWRQGETVDLFLIRVGAVRTSDEWELVVLIENFQKPK